MAQEKSAVRLLVGARTQLEQLTGSGRRSMLVINRARFPLRTGRGWGASWVAMATARLPTPIPCNAPSRLTRPSAARPPSSSTGGSYPTPQRQTPPLLSLPFRR